ncbi:MAG: cryptochrome/photolyase family protein [Phycisphaerales bacterium]|nr:cryptochrome/photolyase family protein [Phycisphaerales bacterium]
MPPKETLLIFPHQLFDEHPGCSLAPSRIALIEDGLFFGDHCHSLAFHRQKLWLHRASMKAYEQRLLESGASVDYVEHAPGVNMLETYLKNLKERQILVAEPHDYLLKRRLCRYCEAFSLQLRFLDTPMFLNTSEENQRYRKTKKRWYMADFYKHQRRRFDVLMENDEPIGSQWSFDKDNRKKVPKKMLGAIPKLPEIKQTEVDKAARQYVLDRYPKNPGRLNELIYPTSHKGAQQWLDAFLEQRLAMFGDYEDAIVKGENTLWHGVLTPMLNIGLLTPKSVLEAVLKHAERNEIPLNSIEGFVRQLIGWREFMRATYEDLGVTMRTTNHWGHVCRIPACFYDGTTGIDPLDDVLDRVLETGYCHHIERLMVLGGFMFLCEFDPDEIYRWFMEMFVDSYDWVMVSNVYAMSQNADGGLITTKPYFSGSSYIRKMSNHSAGDWTAIWDGLYWRWIWNHVEELARNPRWSMMCAMAKKMDSEKREAHLRIAETFLSSLG